ncbi:putative zinc-binding protein [bacterium]|nr:putative zinc-binding protein [bacterium]
MSSSGCGCGRMKYNLVFSCSGAADVGAIADQTARRLAQEKTASMCCAAAIGASDQEIMDIARNAEKVLAIDGCDKDCARIILEKAGFSNVRHLQLETLGMKKKESPVTEDRVENALKSARLALVS